MAQIHLIEGPVGAGKSTYAGRLALELKAVHLDLDAWMVVLFSTDRPDEGFMPWYAERKRRCIDQIWQVAGDILHVDRDVVLELGLVQRADREEFYARVDATDWTLAVHLLEVPKHIRHQRVGARNAGIGSTYKMTVTDEVFELANNAWQPPDEAEISRRAIQIIDNR